MKNALLVLNVLLLIAVGVLFYLHFSNNKNPAVKVASTQKSTAATADCRIAYFEMDSINNSFAMVKEVRNELSTEEEKMNNELTRLQKTYNDKMIQYQNSQNAQSQIESEAVRKDIMDLQNKISERRQTLNQRFQDMYMRKMQEVKAKVEDYLKEYNKDKGFAYILAYEPGFIFYRDTALNITADILKGLNEKYKKK